MILIEEKGCYIRYIEDVPCLYWKVGNVDNASFKKYVDNGVEYFREKKIANANLSIIIDLSEFAPTEIVDINWVNEEIMTLLYIENGIKLIALIPPVGEDLDQRMAVAHEFFEKTEQLHEIAMVESIEDATDWLTNESRRLERVGNYTMFEDQKRS